MTDPRRRQEGDTAAQVRGDIQQGLTGDKRRGFDPAAAPLETDGEAAGTPLTAEEAGLARAGERAGRPVDRSEDFDTAMRGDEEAVPRSLRNRHIALAVLLSLVAATLVITVAGLGLLW
ncbi:hypothetical protein [Ciceribacter ferrooxidans]|uniref:Uncharacterized protein n=1 Tax=Ciceribacter ferrooxidans TaxID=2509717 RepID=A0A4Q2TWQ9_9HYPH|nr:hypothetical protein [Ciceribacter ferrooxidans]RYC27287.1 hypothetical protein EUU22_00775 [Ciceribacter ferrooxidans]